MSRLTLGRLSRIRLFLPSRPRVTDIQRQTCGIVQNQLAYPKSIHSGPARAQNGAVTSNLEASSQHDDGSLEGEVRSTPSFPPQGNVSIVFTDIVKSTALWESDATAMKRAMQIHDVVLRHLCRRNQGYEVKQNGDGFMIAFPKASLAIQFCLDVQEQLLDENWPEGILKLEPGQETTDGRGHLLFRGLKRRMSAHWGAPVCKWNEIISRMDYLGPVVNRAARFVEVTEGGQIVVSEEFLVELQEELQSAKSQKNHDGSESPAYPCEGQSSEARGTYLDLATLRSPAEQERFMHHQFEVRLLGDARFKGLEEPEKLFFVVPRSLKGRADYWLQTRHVEGVKGNIMNGRE